jgi:hypothetical protein
VETVRAVRSGQLLGSWNRRLYVVDDTRIAGHALAGRDGLNSLKGHERAAQRADHARLASVPQ